MNCWNHTDREVQGICSTCGRPGCEECLVDLNGHVHCKPCLETRMRRPDRQISGLFRFVLSVVPGLGHLYMGLFNRGTQFLGAAVLGSFLLEMLFPRSDFSGFYWAILVFLSIFDAREAHLRQCQGLEVEDKGFVDLKTWRFTWNHKYIGYGLIGLGIIGLYNTLVYDLLRLLFRNTPYYYELMGTIHGLTLGLLAIGGGLWMLRKNFNNSAR